MYAHGIVAAIGVMADPPLVAVGEARHEITPGGLECLAVGAGGDGRNHLWGNNLLAIELPLIAQHLGKARQIAQGYVEAGAGPFGADRVQQQVGILFGAQWLPQALADQLGQ